MKLQKLMKQMPGSLTRSRKVGPLEGLQAFHRLFFEPFTADLHMTKKPLTKEGWEVVAGRGTTYGKTKEEVLKRAASSVQRCESEGLSWELHHVVTTLRTKPYPKVLIVGSTGKDGISRPHEKWVEKFNQTNLKPGSRRGRLHWVDSSGTRSVFFYSQNVLNSADYDDAIDLPDSIHKELAVFLKENNVPIHLFLLQEDPGIAIVLPQDKEENHFSYRQEKPLDAFLVAS